MSLTELTVFDQLDDFLGVIMGGVPDDCKNVILEGAAMRQICRARLSHGPAAQDQRGAQEN